MPDLPVASFSAACSCYFLRGYRYCSCCFFFRLFSRRVKNHSCESSVVHALEESYPCNDNSSAKVTDYIGIWNIDVIELACLVLYLAQTKVNHIFKDILEILTRIVCQTEGKKIFVDCKSKVWTGNWGN